jgi:hypothetical protein
MSVVSVNHMILKIDHVSLHVTGWNNSNLIKHGLTPFVNFPPTNIKAIRV